MPKDSCPDVKNLLDQVDGNGLKLTKKEFAALEAISSQIKKGKDVLSCLSEEDKSRYICVLQSEKQGYESRASNNYITRLIDSIINKLESKQVSAVKPVKLTGEDAVTILNDEGLKGKYQPESQNTNSTKKSDKPRLGKGVNKVSMNGQGHLSTPNSSSMISQGIDKGNKNQNNGPVDFQPVYERFEPFADNLSQYLGRNISVESKTSVLNNARDFLKSLPQDTNIDSLNPGQVEKVQIALSMTLDKPGGKFMFPWKIDPTNIKSIQGPLHSYLDKKYNKA